jgi:hypothetical protein
MGNPIRERLTEFAMPVTDKQPKKHPSSAQTVTSQVTHAIKSVIPQPLRRLLRQSKNNFDRRISEATGALPDFIIVGAQKAGTTSLFRYLSGHPHVHPASRKEIGFFNNRLERNLSWYRGHFPSKFQKHYEQIALNRPFLTGEADPAYILDPYAIEAIHDILPDVKIILLLRNPVDRSYSHYQHTRRLGLENLTFDQALECEDDRISIHLQKMMAGLPYKGMPIYHYGYIFTGMYGDQVETLFRIFPRKQVLILKTELFQLNTQGQFNRVLKFLGLQDFQLNLFTQHNKGSYQPLAPKTRRHLAELFTPQLTKIQQMLGDEFTWEI